MAITECGKCGFRTDNHAAMRQHHLRNAPFSGYTPCDQVETCPQCKGRISNREFIHGFGACYKCAELA